MRRKQKRSVSFYDRTVRPKEERHGRWSESGWLHPMPSRNEEQFMYSLYRWSWVKDGAGFKRQRNDMWVVPKVQHICFDIRNTEDGASFQVPERHGIALL